MKIVISQSISKSRHTLDRSTTTKSPMAMLIIQAIDRMYQSSITQIFCNDFEFSILTIGGIFQMPTIDRHFSTAYHLDYTPINQYLDAERRLSRSIFCELIR